MISGIGKTVRALGRGYRGSNNIGASGRAADAVRTARSGSAARRAGRAASTRSRVGSRSGGANRHGRAGGMDFRGMDLSRTNINSRLGVAQGVMGAARRAAPVGRAGQRAGRATGRAAGSAASRAGYAGGKMMKGAGKASLAVGVPIAAAAGVTSAVLDSSGPSGDFWEQYTGDRNMIANAAKAHIATGASPGINTDPVDYYHGRAVNGEEYVQPSRNNPYRSRGTDVTGSMVFGMYVKR